jgi:uncharacterized protein (DUF2147 family)
MFMPGMMKQCLIAFAILLAPAAAAGGLTGVWVTDDGLGAVQFTACGEAICGNIVWMKDPLGKDGRPQPDVNNPAPALRGRPLCGAQVIKALALQPDGTWDKGTVYDPEEGKSYSVAVNLLPDGNLEVTGYLGLKVFGETMVWTRAPADLAKCGNVKDGKTVVIRPR